MLQQKRLEVSEVGDVTVVHFRDQRIIDEFFVQAGPESISSLVADINNDGIYDSALVLMGLSKSVDQNKLIDDIYDIIDPYF